MSNEIYSKSNKHKYSINVSIFIFRLCIHQRIILPSPHDVIEKSLAVPAADGHYSVIVRGRLVNQDLHVVRPTETFGKGDGEGMIRARLFDSRDLHSIPPSFPLASVMANLTLRRIKARENKSTRLTTRIIT